MKGTKKFKLLLSSDFYKQGDVLESYNKQRVKVLDTPKKHYSKWYWRILNILTFKLFFNYTYTYTVKIID